ncbi:MAG: hypothetical protein HBSAPP03_00200 [Phycisphaerae bacterium]|nr:MAG: hypothetical protein HBSAPP03_00200 [Phycisphaerae bacterium]
MPHGQAPRYTLSSPYSLAATRPLHVLLFLLPLLIAYEIGSIVYLSGQGSGEAVLGARRLFAAFFEAFGAAGLHAPPILVVVVLLIWHLMLRDPGKPRPWVLVGMGLESCVWAVPLLVFSLVLAGRTPAMAGVVAPSSWEARLTVAIGAGIYEELIFRLLLISAAHFVLVDLLRLKDRMANGIAVVISAGAFVLLHHFYPPMGVAMTARAMMFFAVAGAYFSIVFLTRGFGVVVVTHALYDTVVLLAFPYP